MILTISGCGSSDLTGQYQGKDSDGILCINTDKTWSYEQEGDWGNSDIYWEGTYRKDKDGKYVLECDDIILYAEFTTEDILYVYANSSKWEDEDFVLVDEANRDVSDIESMSVSENVNDIKSENVNYDITRGYNISTTAAEIIEKEEENKDTTLIGGSYTTSIWDEDKGIYVYTIEETNAPEEMHQLEYKGGNFLGIEAEGIEYTFSDRGLALMYYIFMDNDYDKVKQKISKEFDEYRIVDDLGECWSMEDYNVRIDENYNDERIGVRVYFGW